MINEDMLQMALGFVERERKRQEELKAAGRFKHTPADALMPEPEKLLSIIEETGEVARNTMARSYLVTDGDRTDDAMLKELSQVAALSVAWMEGILIRNYVEGDKLDQATGQGRR